ncbi:hypothetical protein N7L95_29075 (plasmid) [Eleftheria terrae]|nr:transposase [Eleftheria terrae]WKB56110.1 hypothetical protein N7L95_29075 [Eleftheria terrae]
MALGETDAHCLAHARRKCCDHWANNHSQIAEEAVGHFGKRYDVDRKSAAP